MKKGRWLAIGLHAAALGLVACHPVAGDPCSPDEDDGMECDGSEALLCVCDEPDGVGGCPANEGHWEVDSLCSCDSLGHVLCE